MGDVKIKKACKTKLYRVQICVYVYIYIYMRTCTHTHINKIFKYKWIQKIPN